MSLELLETQDFLTFIRTVISKCPVCGHVHLGIVPPSKDGDKYISPALTAAETDNELNPLDPSYTIAPIPLIILRCYKCKHIITFDMEGVTEDYKNYLSSKEV
jgi:hypothetical protein